MIALEPLLLKCPNCKSEEVIWLWRGETIPVSEQDARCSLCDYQGLVRKFFNLKKNELLRQ